MPELVTSPHTTLPVDTPPLVAVKVQSSLSQRARGGRQCGARERTGGLPPSLPEAVSVPVDTSPTVVKFPALAVLMVRVLPVILMLSELVPVPPARSRISWLCSNATSVLEVSVARALGADHPAPLRVKEVGLVRELQDGPPGSSEASTCCLTRCRVPPAACHG